MGGSEGMRELSLFTGAGGGLLGTLLLGWKHIGYVEKEPYCQRIIAQRIRDGILDDAPIFGDIRTFISEGYAASYTGVVDVITAGFPCQPFSVAGKQKGADDERNMWPSTAECIGIVRPRFVLLENVPGIRAYLPVVVRDLRRLGYEVSRPLILGADDVGAPHRRKRVWIVADYADSGAEGMRRERQDSILQTADTKSRERLLGYENDAFCLGREEWQERCGSYFNAPHSPQRQDDERDGRGMDGTAEGREGINAAAGVGDSDASDAASVGCQDGRGVLSGLHRPEAGNGKNKDLGDNSGYSWADPWPEVAARLCRVDDGVAHRMDRLKCLGNGQVPLCMAAAWKILFRGIG